MIGETGERKSAVATPDGKSRKKKKKSPTAFSVSSERHRDTQSQLSRARFLHQKFNMPGPGIEPSSLAWQANVLTITLTCLSALQGEVQETIQYTKACKRTLHGQCA